MGQLMQDSGFELKPMKSRKKFAEMYAKGKRFSTRKLMLTYELRDLTGAEIEANEAIETIAFAVVVGKKTAKRAVIRNRIKRLLRESMRLYFSVVFGDFEKQPLSNIIINWRQAPAHPGLIGLEEVSSELLFALDKVKKQFLKHTVKQEKQ